MISAIEFVSQPLEDIEFYLLGVDEKTRELNDLKSGCCGCKNYSEYGCGFDDCFRNPTLVDRKSV